MKILIVEDKQELLNSISDYMSNNSCLCDMADNIYTAREKIALFEYDCVILDLTLPVGDGLSILKELKMNKAKAGVLIISAKNSLDDKLIGLELGADDYLTKPFHLPELAARVHAINRRRSFDGNDIIEIDKISINIQDMYVETSNGSVDLTRKEYELLIYFISNKNRVVTKESILDHLWGQQANMTDNYDLIYVHVKNLRKKLTDKGCPDYISAVYGVGYRFSVPKIGVAV
jgi:DNA-binding response OmpR family regulator